MRSCAYADAEWHTARTRRSASSAEGALKNSSSGQKAKDGFGCLVTLRTKKLHALVSGAACLLFPSLFEGSEFPWLKRWSSACGCCSSACSPAEIGGTRPVILIRGKLSRSRVCGRRLEKCTWDATHGVQGQAQSHRFNYLDSAAELLDGLRETPARREAPQAAEIAVLSRRW